MPTDRVAIFIDAGYLNKVIEKQFPTNRVDYSKIAPNLAPAQNILRSYYYNCPPFQGNPPTVEESEKKAKSDTFYAALKRIPRFEIRLGRLAKRSCSKCGEVSLQQKRADLMLGVDIVSLSAKGQIATAILIAGDSDFLPAVTSAKECGVLVHLYHGGPANPSHRDLFDACDERTLIDKALIDLISLPPKTTK